MNSIVWHDMPHTCIELGIEFHQRSTLEGHKLAAFLLERKYNISCFAFLSWLRMDCFWKLNGAVITLRLRALIGCHRCWQFMCQLQFVHVDDSLGGYTAWTLEVQCNSIGIRRTCDSVSSEYDVRILGFVHCNWYGGLVFQLEGGYNFELVLRDLAAEFCAVVLNPWEMSMLTEMIRAHIQFCFLACTPNRMPHNHDAGGPELWLRRARTYILKGTHPST